MSDLKMNMSLDDIIKNNKDDTNINKTKGYINKPRFNKNNYVSNYQKDSDDNKERRNFKSNINYRPNFYNRDPNNKSYRNVFNPHYKNRFENVHGNKVSFIIKRYTNLRFLMILIITI
jgi:hypothetical protein